MEKAQEDRLGFETQNVERDREKEGEHVRTFTLLPCHGDSGGFVFTDSLNIYAMPIKGQALCWALGGPPPNPKTSPCPSVAYSLLHIHI